MYVSHHQISDRLLGIKPGQHVTVAGVRVERLPDGDARAPKASRFCVGGGEPAGLLKTIDVVMLQAGYSPVPGGSPWRDADEPTPPPSYGRRAAAPDGPASG
jgi:hypothetical protein